MYSVKSFFLVVLALASVAAATAANAPQALKLKSASASFPAFRNIQLPMPFGRIKLILGQTPHQGDQMLEYVTGSTIKASRGFGYLGRHTSLKTLQKINQPLEINANQRSNTKSHYLLLMNY